MDPFSTEGELINMHNAFHQGQYHEVISFDTSDLSPSNALPARILTLRARLALGETMPVLTDLKGATEPALQAVAALGLLQAAQADKAVGLAEHLAATAPEDPTVQVLAGTVLQATGKADEALALLAGHQGSLEAVALIVQIHLAQNRNDLALKEVAAARRWAQDSLLVNLAESWVGLRLGGERYQQAFYVYEELAQAPSTSSVRSLVSQAVAELHLGRLEESQAALEEALAKEPSYPEAIANLLVLTAVAGKDISELTEKLKDAEPQHHFLVDLEEKSALFDAAAAKYSPKVAA
ncbi:hypothetical protein TD95_004214 [Thielaviopsis punctulata]|uniref:Coatomer subunit epsilon n=1 Tax=Thielaviopsis punctulata TaxID=72032 RepID=A0A0F4ZLE1_9PEZI|nr:hypothetical protein TD95_004214 [Thielaviopsis punctulata]